MYFARSTAFCRLIWYNSLDYSLRQLFLAVAFLRLHHAALELMVCRGYKNQGPYKGAIGLQVVTWMPQNDILAHPKTRVFVTHCGMNSLYEVRGATYGACHSQRPDVAWCVGGNVAQSSISLPWTLLAGLTDTAALFESWKSLF